ncbi:MAG TPA: hypothetical protein VIU61_15575 [Kofleriaceae bacterium]
MKMLSLKNLIGLGAIGGAMYYARKNGGFQNLWNQISAKAKEAKDEVIGKAHEVTQQQPASSSYSSTRSAVDDTNYGTGYPGSGNIRH